jgi:hypothetical protein
MYSCIYSVCLNILHAVFSSCLQTKNFRPFQINSLPVIFRRFLTWQREQVLVSPFTSVCSCHTFQRINPLANFFYEVSHSVRDRSCVQTLLFCFHSDKGVVRKQSDECVSTCSLSQRHLGDPRPKWKSPLRPACLLASRNK